MFNMINLDTKLDETHSNAQNNMSKDYGDSIDSIVFSRADASRIAQREFAKANTNFKNNLLNAIADSIENNAEFIEEANKQDLEKAQKNGMDAGKLDRLKFDEERIFQSAKSIRKIAQLQDPVGEVVRGYTLENGL
ncbi:gamma-glutamyl-phosphate reductase, partial [Gardnerella vaginalis]